MKNTHVAALGSLGLLISTASGALYWSVGIDDSAQTQADATDLGGVIGSAAAIQEFNGSTPLPGNPANTGGTGGTRDIDDDFYFEGVYSTVVDGGTYTPVGIVGTREAFYERAVTNGDSDLRWHFNTPASTAASDSLTFTIDFFSLDDDSTGTGFYDLEMLIDGVSQGTQTVSNPGGTVDTAISWTFTGADVGGAAEAGSGFDHYVEIRSTTGGGARWASLDYAQLDITPVPEPTTGLFGLLGVVALLHRRR